MRFCNYGKENGTRQKIYADGIEDESLRIGLGTLSLVEKALQEGSTSLPIDQSISFHQTLYKLL